MKTRGDGMAADEDTMRPEYDFSHGKRGVTARRYAQGANVVASRRMSWTCFPTVRPSTRPFERWLLS